MWHFGVEAFRRLDVNMFAKLTKMIYLNFKKSESHIRLISETQRNFARQKNRRQKCLNTTRVININRKSQYVKFYITVRGFLYHWREIVDNKLQRRESTDGFWERVSGFKFWNHKCRDSGFKFTTFQKCENENECTENFSLRLFIFLSC